MNHCHGKLSPYLVHSIQYLMIYLLIFTGGRRAVERTIFVNAWRTLRLD